MGWQYIFTSAIAIITSAYYFVLTYCIDCGDGYFGDGCISQRYCRTDTCEKLTGMCPGNRCQLGWMGKSCSQGNIFQSLIRGVS